jgi:hypothetical protein
VTPSAANPLVRLGELGQSPWYDYITRDLVTTGELGRLIAEDGLRGMTSNPTIFEKAIAGSRLYDDEIRTQADAGRSPQEIFEHLAVADVRAACDLFAPVFAATGGPTAWSRSRWRRPWPTTPTPPSSRPSGCGGRSTGPTR